MRLRLTPRSAPITEALTELTVLVREGVAVLRDSLGANSAGRDQDLDRLRALAGQGAKARDHLTELTRHAFVLPYDRGDLHSLGVHLTEVLNQFEQVVDAGIRHRVDAGPEGSTGVVDALERMAELTATALPRLARHTEVPEVTSFPAEMRRLTQRAERVRAEMLAEALATGADPLVGLRLLVVADHLTQAVRGFAQVASVVEGIVVKES